MLSLSQAFAQWNGDNGMGSPQDIHGADRAALAESWGGYTDSLCKAGDLCALQYEFAPAYDEPMPEDDRAFILAALGVTLAATFVPFSQSRSKAEKHPSLNWLVTVKVRDRAVVSTDYMQGSAHAPAYNAPSFHPGPDRKRDQYATDKRIRMECETGKACGAFGVSPTSRPISPPSVVDVLACLLLDASVIDAGSFSDWCGEYGYDDDSIKARAMYDGCMATALALRSGLGAKRVEELNELFQDY